MNERPLAPRALNYLISLAMAIALVGCSEPDPCDGVVCEAGVCLDGACADGPSCDGPGCGTTCSTAAHCGEGEFCSSEGSCVADPCVDVTCERGVCEVGTGQCVDAAACSSSDESACLEGSRCFGGTCVDEARFCEELACDRGVCSFDDLACVNADGCEGDDSLCVPGFYCDTDTCRPNRCDGGTECARGECEASTGACVNPARCSSTDECIDANLCVAGTCVEADAACGAGGCTGNQTCEYDEDTLKAQCSESPDGCESALDCSGVRQCVDGACADPSPCSADSFEPNDGAVGTTAFQQFAVDDVLADLTLCPGDVDAFTFDSMADDAQRGVLLVELDVESADVGIGTLTLELLDAEQSVVASSRTFGTDGATGHARVEHEVTFVNSGEYTVRVSSDDMTTAGVRYALRADILDGASVAACKSARPLDLSNPITSNTLTADSVALTTTCGDSNAELGEDVWHVTVEDEGVLTVQATPSLGSDISLSIRTACERVDSELPGACVDDAADSLPERIALPVVPGDYVVLVESSGAGGGSYTLSAVFEPVVCEDSDNVCVDEATARICNAFGTGFDVVECEYGCGEGQCLRDPGDVCTTATVVDPATGYTGFINWSDYSPDYDPATGGCVPNNSITSETDGPDAVYTVDLAPDHVLSASLARGNGAYASLYLTTDCRNITTTCLASSNVGRLDDEHLTYHNETGATQTVFLIADSASNSRSTTAATIDISIDPFLCTPGESRCLLDRESQVCNRAGTAYDATVLCEFGCDGGTGRCKRPLNDVCGGAIPLVEGVETSLQDLSILANDYDATTHGNCPLGTGGPKSGADSTFLLEGLTAGEVVTLTMTSDFNASLWVGEDCTGGDVVGACIAGADDHYSSAPEVLRFIAPRDGDFVVVAEAANFTAGTFRLKYTVAPPTCTPNTTSGCNAAGTGVEYCDSYGDPQTHPCGSGGCDGSTGQCTSPTGDVCADPIRIATAPGMRTNGTRTGAHDDGSVSALNPSAGEHGRCTFAASPDELDTIYAFDLAPGDLLTIDFESDSTAGRAYLLEDCHGVSSCQFNMVGDGVRQYLAEDFGTVFFVVDHVYAATQRYSFDWNVEPSPSLVCVPGTRACDGSTLLEICSDDGATASYQACPGGCSNLGGCVQEGNNDTCGSALDAGTGMHVVVDPADYGSSVDDGCGLETSGADAFYSVSLGANQLLRVTGIPSDVYDDAAVYVFTDCADVNGSCLAGMQMQTGDDTAEVFYLATQAETVLVGLDTDSSADDDPFYYAIEILPPECSDADPVVCNAAGDGVEYCQNSLKRTYDCAGPCSAGVCQAPTGDTCWDSFDLAQETSPLIRSWKDSTPLVNAGSGLAGACAFDDYGAGAGQEHVYRIDLAAGDLLHVAETSTVSTVLYLVGDCLAPQSTCLVNDRNTEAISYHARAAETVFLVVDRTSTQPTVLDYTLEWAITQGSTCAPGQSYCVDASTASVCLDGVNSTGPYACANGCVDGSCLEDASMDACSTAPTLSAGGGISLLYDASDFADDISTSCAGGITTPGPDLFFRVDLQARDIVRARSVGVGKESPALYFVTDCDEPAKSCIGGARGSHQTAHEVEIEHQAAVAQTLWVGVDSVGTNDDELFQVQIDVLTPNCVPGQFEPTCDTAGTGIVYCDATGFTRSYRCAGAGVCDATTTNRCAEPVGEACVDPLEATPAASGVTSSFSGDFSTLANDHDLPVANTCLPSQAPGSDSAYVVDLQAGETLTASLVSTVVGNEQDVALYLVTDCADIEAACLGGSDAAGASPTPETVTYTATADESVVLIVDSFFENVFGTYRLDVVVD